MTHGKHYYAPLRQPIPLWRYLAGIALYAYSDSYLVIRYIDFVQQHIDGDSWFETLQEAKSFAEDAYGVLESDWQEMPREQWIHIPIFIEGKRVPPDEL